MDDCPDCGGSGWFWWPGADAWAACATCNDDEHKPRPTGALAERLKREAPVPIYPRLRPPRRKAT